MEQNDQPNLYAIITIKNIDTNPINIIYNRVNYGTIKPSEVKRLPFFLARHVIKHLIDQILNRLQKPTSNLEMRLALENEIVLEREDLAKDAPQTEEERLRAEIDRLNGLVESQRMAVHDESVLGGILNKPREEAPPIPEEAEVEVATPLAANDGLVGDHLSESSTLNEAIDPATVSPDASSILLEETPPPALTVNADPINPNREQLYGYARDVLKMDLSDKKTMEALDKMDEEQLKKELNYEPEALQ